MDISLAVATFTTIVSALYLRHERRRLERLLSSDQVNIYLHLEPEEAGVALPIDVHSDEAESRRSNAQWN